MNKAPERIWVEDERGLGGDVWLHDGPTQYKDPCINEYVRADLADGWQARALKAEAKLAKAVEWTDKLSETLLVINAQYGGRHAARLLKDFRDERATFAEIGEDNG